MSIYISTDFLCNFILPILKNSNMNLKTKIKCENKQ